MTPRQFILPLAHELVVDLFAGGGGASTGIEQAIGRHVDIAVNHDPQAVSLHEANHPQTRHFVSDVFEVDPVAVTEGRPIGLMWASPDCKHFSKAKGGKPVSKKIRGLAGIVIKWVKALRPTDCHPRVICLENVEEFQTWGPLLKNGRPCPMRKGQTFHRWVNRLRNLGYVVEWRELRACDYGAPTIRKRLFLVARRDGEPIVWPAPTHGHGLLPYLTAADCIDWTIPCPSIFERERQLAPATLRRIAHGVMRYVITAAKPYIVRIGHTGHGDSGKVRAASDPVSTITSKAEHCLVSSTLVQTGYGERPGQAPRVPGLHKPLGTCVDGQKHALVAAFLAKHYTGVVGSSLTEPIGTVTSVDHHSLVAASLGKLRGTSSSASAADPLHTVSAQGQHHALVASFLSAYYGSDQDTPLSEPMHTVTTKPRFALVTVDGVPHAIADIGMRMLQPRELYRAQGFPDTYIIDRGADGRQLPKDAQVRMCGNSVCPPLARALVAANFVEAVREAANDNRRRTRRSA
ncbi:MAG: DNA cytosine methyltransferase [Burkholderiaceae bacterium]|nr:DNA cytosine methyltransferase [Burkholderiaceae bacterium]